MKSSFLSILFSILAAISVAQNFELGLNADLADYSVHNIYSKGVYNNVTLYQSSVIAVPLSASVLYNYKKFQFGAAIETSTINYKSRYQPDFGILPYITLNNRVHETPVKLFANKLLHFKKIEGYVGLSGLYNFLKSAGNEFVQTSHTSSIGFGAQAGATYFISKHIGLNAEISGRSNNFPAGPLDKNIITVPVTIGFRYKL